MLFAGPALAQSDLPETGTLSDLAGRTRVYLIADGEARPAMLKLIEKQKGLTVTGKPDDAEFFLEYKSVSRQEFGFGGTTETGQLYAFFYRDKRKVIAWERSGTGGGFKGDTAKSLTKKFFSDLSKMTTQTKP